MRQIKRLLSNWYVFSIVSRISLVLIGLASSVVSSRYLGATLKGETAYITSMVLTIDIFTSFGLHQAYPYFRKKLGKEQFLSKFMTNVSFLHVVYMAIAIIFCFCVDNIETKIICINIPIASYYRISHYVAVIEKPNRIQLCGVVVDLAYLALYAMLMVTIPASFGIAVAILLSSDIILSIINTIYLKPQISRKLIDPHMLYELGKYGFFPMISLLLSTMNYRVDTIMMKKMDCISTAQLGVYSIGITLAQKVLLIPEAVKTILLAKLSRDKGPEEVAMATRCCFPIAIITCLGIIALGRPFINLLYGGEFTGAYEVTVATMIGIISIMFYKMIATYNNVNRLQKINVVFLSIAVVLNIIMNAILLPKLNIVGGALASTISYTICAMMFIIHFRYTTGVSYKDIVLINRNDIAIMKSLMKTREKNENPSE